MRKSPFLVVLAGALATTSFLLKLLLFIPVFILYCLAAATEYLCLRAGLYSAKKLSSMLCSSEETLDFWQKRIERLRVALREAERAEATVKSK